MIDDQIDGSAAHIRNLWVNAHRDMELRTKGKSTGWGQRTMPQWDGGIGSDGKHHKNVWLKIAEFVAQNDLDAAILVTSIFYKQIDFIPTPNFAVGAKALERYNDYMSPGTQLEIRADLTHAFESQKQRATSDVFTKVKYYKLDEKDAWRITIGSRTVPLTPLFRYCVAVNQNWTEIAEQFYPTARKQYRQLANLYDEVWGEWIPSEFKARAMAKKECVA